MGYYYSADFTITIPETTAAAVVLDMDTLIARLNTSPIPGLRNTYTRSSFESQNVSGETLIDRLFDFCGFDWSIENVDKSAGPAGSESSESSESSDGTLVYRGWANTKWHESTEKIVLFLADHGAGVTMSCTGEDDERWRYDAVTGSGKGTQDSVIGVPLNRLKTLETAQARVLEIRSLLADPARSTRTVDEVYALIEGILASETLEEVPA